jgi:hypothetical protein
LFHDKKNPLLTVNIKEDRFEPNPEIQYLLRLKLYYGHVAVRPQMMAQQGRAATAVEAREHWSPFA